VRTYKFKIYAAVAVWFCFLLTSCEREPRISANSSDTGTIEQRYGLAGTYEDRLNFDDDATSEATIVPITLSDGRTAQLVIPKAGAGDHRVFLRDQNGLSPIVLDNPRMTREEFIRSEPRVVERSVAKATPPQKKKRSWQREALIIGGGGGAGAAIGAVAGGKKGAAVGAISGGVAGLIYDLATRHK